MIKYKDAYIVFEEIPDKLALAVNITNCQNMCIGCHSPELRLNNGSELTNDEVDNLIKKNYGVNCFLFMGEGKDKERLLDIAKYIKENHKIEVAVYSGRDSVEEEYFGIFDYIKIGRYDEKFGPLNKDTTNQRLYKIEDGNRVDITYKFWRKGGH